ncbi:nuclear transport factor 2 family protein [Streptomyces chartreusis]
MKRERSQISSEIATATAGAKHVVLTYHYLDIGDTEGYASLTEKDLVFDHPGVALQQGRDAVLRAHAAQATAFSRHELTTVVADEGVVVALGRVLRPVPGGDGRAVYGADFADVVTLSEQTLVKSCRRYYYAPPPGPSSPLLMP